MFRRRFSLVAGSVIGAAACRRRPVLSPRGALDSTHGPVSLGRDGRAVLPIVNGSRTGAAAAATVELADVLEAVVGDRPRVEERRPPFGGRGGIVLTTASEMPRGELHALIGSSGVRSLSHPEAYALSTAHGGDTPLVWVIGASELGLRHAVADLAVRCGARFLAPARHWHVFPRLPSLKLTTSVIECPALDFRRLWWEFGLFDDRATMDHRLWAQRNRLGGAFAVETAHAWEKILVDRRADFEAHPEYLALLTESGRSVRRGNMFCLSNAALRRLVSEWALEQLEKEPDRTMVSVEPADESGHCTCTTCATMGTISDRVFGLANEVARAVALTHSQARVGLYAYNLHADPPSFRLADNVHVLLAPRLARGSMSADELLRTWPAHATSFGLYEYLSVFAWGKGELPGGLALAPHDLAVAVRKYFDAGASTFDGESCSDWALCGRGYWVAAQLLWNPAADVDNLLADFDEHAFGPAAPIMSRFYARLRPDNCPEVTPAAMLAAFYDIRHASRAAKAIPDVQRRLDDVRHWLQYVELSFRARHSPDIDTRRRTAIELLRHAFRVRRSYAIHWEAVRQVRVADFVATLGITTRDLGLSELQAEFDRPYRREEIDLAFDRGETFFRGLVE